MKTRIYSFFCALLLSCLTLGAKDFVLVIDAGHGGKDYGAIGSFTNEKTINLAVAKLFGELVEKKFNDVKVVYTRDKDVFVSLNDRARIANKAEGDLFVSIHVNSVAKNSRNRTTVAGAEVYTLGLHRTEDNLAVARRENSVIEYEEDNKENYHNFDPESPESYIIFELGQSAYMDKSIEFAELSRNQLVSVANRQDKGVKQAGFWVLWATSMPSVLVELDFICNPQSEQFLASENGQKQLATALFNSFAEYKAISEGKPSDSLKFFETPSLDSEEPRSSDIPDMAVTDEAEKKDGSAVVPTWNSVSNVNDKTLPVDNNSGTDYRIQILASSTQLPLRSAELKGESGVEHYYDRGMYKYTVGHFSSEREAEKTLKKIKNKFPQAFIVKFVDGVRVN